MSKGPPPPPAPVACYRGSHNTYWVTPRVRNHCCAMPMAHGDLETDRRLYWNLWNRSSASLIAQTHLDWLMTPTSTSKWPHDCTTGVTICTTIPPNLHCATVDGSTDVSLVFLWLLVVCVGCALAAKMVSAALRTAITATLVLHKLWNSINRRQKFWIIMTCLCAAHLALHRTGHGKSFSRRWPRKLARRKRQRFRAPRDCEEVRPCAVRRGHRHFDQTNAADGSYMVKQMNASRPYVSREEKQAQNPTLIEGTRIQSASRRGRCDSGSKHLCRRRKLPVLPPLGGLACTADYIDDHAASGSHGAMVHSAITDIDRLDIPSNAHQQQGWREWLLRTPRGGRRTRPEGGRHGGREFSSHYRPPCIWNQTPSNAQVLRTMPLDGCSYEGGGVAANLTWASSTTDHRMQTSDALDWAPAARIDHCPCVGVRIGEAAHPGPGHNTMKKRGDHSKTHSGPRHWLKEAESRINGAGAKGGIDKRVNDYALTLETANGSCWRTLQRYINKNKSGRPVATGTPPFMPQKSSGSIAMVPQQRVEISLVPR
jgi:hypothetical protein